MKVRTHQGKTTIIETDPEEIEHGTGMATGMGVATITVAHHDGGITRFFVSLRFKRGRVICEVANNNLQKGTVTSRRLTGHKERN